MYKNLQNLGAGIGLRHRYMREIVDKRPKFDWFEVIAEDFFNIGGEDKELLTEIGNHYPLVSHGVCLSVGSSDPIDFDYLRLLKGFIKEIDSPWTSDHLCFTRVDHENLNDLLPLPYIEECLDNIVAKIGQVQDYLECPFLVENISRYVTPSAREMSEVEFVSEVVNRSGCGLLLDLTNIYLNSVHHGFSPEQYLRSLPLSAVGQIHLAGWQPDSDGRLIDSHDAPVPEEIWALFELFLVEAGSVSAMVERDKAFPVLSELEQEAERIRKLSVRYIR